MENDRENLTVAFDTHAVNPGLTKSLVTLRPVFAGLLIAMVAANMWPLLLLNLGVSAAAIVEVIFLTLYVWWAAGGGPPRRWQMARAAAFRRKTLSLAQWAWGVVAAFFFAVMIHASLVLLFRFVPFPTTEFRHGYDFSFIPTLHLRWLAVIISAISAGICEETGFRGYMQQPIELRYGAPVAIAISSILFLAVHLTKSWALIGMIPIVFGAGILLGLLARSSKSLIPGMIGHTMMDVGLFAYWWTGVAGTFSARPISESGVDGPFVVACAALTISFSIVLLAISKLRRSTRSDMEYLSRPERPQL
jgi:membrane protease YdiL (CAAX protease family)